MKNFYDVVGEVGYERYKDVHLTELIGHSMRMVRVFLESESPERALVDFRHGADQYSKESPWEYNVIKSINSLRATLVPRHPSLVKIAGDEVHLDAEPGKFTLDISARQAVYQEGLMTGRFTVNQIRSHEGYAPVPDGDSKYQKLEAA